MPAKAGCEELEQSVGSLQRELSALKRAAGSVLVHQGFEEAAHALFDVCKDVVGATSGYVALSTEDGAENEIVYLDSGGAPCNVDPNLPMPIRGLRAETFREGRAVYDNDFSNSRWMQYLPEGHLLLRNVLFAPLIIDGNAVGLLGLANKPADFTPEDADIAALLGEFAAIALRNAKSEDARNRFARSLIESEDRFHKLYSTMNEGVGLHELIYHGENDPVDYRVLDVNRKYEEITGLSKKELTGKTASELFGPGKPPYFEAFARVAESGEPISFEAYWLPLDKHLLISVFSPAKGQFATVLTDITERKKAERALQKNERLLNEMGRMARIGGWEIDAGTLEVTWTPETYRIHEVPIGQKPPLDKAIRFFHPEDRPLLEDAIQRALEQGEPYDLELRFITAGGRHLWTHTIGKPEVVNGRTVKITGTLQDVTERKKTEDALRENRLFLQNIFDAIQDGISVLDRDLNIVRVNAWVENTFSSCWTVVGQKCYAVFRKRAEPCPDCPTLKVLAGGERHSAVIPYPSNEAPSSWYNVSVFPLKDSAGRVTGVIEYFKDVTKETLAERELRKAHEELEQRIQERTEELRRRSEQLSRLSSELTLAEQRERSRVAEVIHDQLQQLLVGAKMRLEMLSSKVRDDHRQAAQDIHMLIEEALQGSRSLTKELSAPVLHESGLAAALEWLAHWLKENHGLTVDMDLDANATPTQQNTKVLLYQSVRELLLNVVKHAGTSRARVRMRRNDENHLRIVVEDDGVGFDPDESRKNDDLFSGFGLFSIRERLDLLGGRLEVESKPGKGSTFTLLAPLEVEQPASALKAPQTGNEAQGEEPPAAGSGWRHRVLLVDDHTVMRQGIAALLEGHDDIEVVGEAADGGEAVEQARALQPDVILMDINMPGMNGIQATRIIHSESPWIRIIGLSINEAEAAAGPIKEAGAVTYLSKSGSSESILQAIRNAGD
ncbi:MAG: PAS domain-containing protein [Deltaproteobacteria bacterium]|nr:PAS domain-containing protein [Deltaproteobacteria bacterium]